VGRGRGYFLNAMDTGGSPISSSPTCAPSPGRSRPRDHGARRPGRGQCDAECLRRRLAGDAGRRSL